MGIKSANIEKDFKNKLLKRRELLVSLEFEGPTPSREEIKRVLADKLNLNQENLVVVRAQQDYGTMEGSVLVHEYKDKEAMRIAQKHVVSRPNKKKEKAPAQQTAAAAPQAAQAKEGEAK